MEFSNKLSLLAEVFKISNSKLARAINVDASLISRWKTGDRTLNAQSRHVAALASFFVKIQAYPYQKNYLDNLLSALQPEEAILTDEDKVHLLANWLVQPGHHLPSHVPNDPAQTGKPEKLVPTINNWFEKSHDEADQNLSGIKARGKTGWSYSMQTAPRSNDEIYQGLAGKRQAIVNYLLEVLNQPHPAELLLVSEEDMRWLTGDWKFLQAWADLVRQVIQQGHKITIIHIVNRRTDEINNVLEHWLPLHLSGQIDSFYLPRYVDPIINQTIFILRGQAVCLSQSTNDPTTQGLTFLSRNESVINHYTAIYESVLRSCQPFFSIYTPLNIKSLTESSGVYPGLGQQYNVRHQPDTRFLPANVRKDLGRIAYPFQPVLTGHSDKDWIVYDIMPLTFLEEIHSEAFLLQSDCELFLKKPFQLSPAATSNWLDNLIWYIQENPTYNLYFYQTPTARQPLSFNLNYYTNQAAHFAAKSSKEPFILALHEANSLHSLGLYLENFIARIPSSQRSRKDVLARLAIASDKLKERVN